MFAKRVLVMIAATAAALSSRAAAGPSLRVWPVDPHVKVFRDTQPGAPGAVTLRAARNEYEPGQFAVRSGTRAEGLRVEMSPLRHADGSRAIGGEHVRWNFVGFIPIRKNTPASEAIRVRKAPCEVPDPLLESRRIDLGPDVTQPVWITVFVPKDAPAGQYRGEATVIAGEARAMLPVELTVDSFTLPDQRHVLVTNWFTSGNIARPTRPSARGTSSGSTSAATRTATSTPIASSTTRSAGSACSTG